MRELDNIWPKNITVDKRIVKILSESTYENFPRALKELVTNSYDADARTVLISVNLKEEQIIIEDDGKGMDDSDFTFYLRIAGKKREKESNVTPLGRNIIGQFGVGFLSIFPFFKLTKSFFQTKARGLKSRKNDPLYEPQGVELLKWTLSEDLPLRFENDKFNDIFKYKDEAPFNVYVNGEKLYRNTFGDEILEIHKGAVQTIEFQGTASTIVLTLKN